MQLIKILVFVILGVLGGVSAKTFTKCSLAQELAKNGIDVKDLPNWVCLVQSESNYNTAAVGGPNENNTKDWGLFQINDGFWCKEGSPGGDCNLDCRALLEDSIVEAVKCAKIIFNRHGYEAWYGWQNKCKGRPLPSVNECF